MGYELDQFNFSIKMENMTWSCLKSCFHGYGLTCQFHIRPEMKENVLSFQMIYDVALCRLNF